MARPMVLNGPANEPQTNDPWAPPLSPLAFSLRFAMSDRWFPVGAERCFPNYVRPFSLTRLPVAFPEGKRKKTICDRVYITNKYTCYR